MFFINLSVTNIQNKVQKKANLLTKILVAIFSDPNLCYCHHTVHACVFVCECVIACLDVKTHTGGVCSVGVILQDSGQAEVRHLTHQVAVDQDVAGSQVAVDVAQVRQVGHSCRDAAQQPNQLDDGELAVVSLQEQNDEKVRRDGGVQQLKGRFQN